MSNNIRKIYKNLVKLFFYFLYGNIEINNNLKLIEKIKIKNKYFGNYRYYIYKIKDGVTFTDNTQNVAAISNNKLHAEPSFQHGNDKIISPKFNPVLKRGLINFRKKYDGIVLSLVQGASTENYFHWLMDILPKIKIYSSRYLVKKVDYFYLPNLTSSQKQSLQYLGIQSKKIINSSLYKHISAKKIFFVSHPWYTKGKFHDQSHKLPKWQINWIRTTFIKFRKKFKISKNIYIDRSESKHSHCQIINHTELKEYLKKKNFSIVKLANQKFSKQIFMFWNADCIIGAHGAALTNLVFCKPKTKVLEIKPFGHPGQNYKRISKINNLKYYSIVSEKKYLNKENGDIFINIKKLGKKINL